MDSAGRALLAIVGSVMTLAILSVVLSQRANTANVISAATGGLGTLISDAEAPVSGGGSSGSSGLSSISSILGSFNSFFPGGADTALTGFP